MRKPHSLLYIVQNYVWIGPKASHLWLKHGNNLECIHIWNYSEWVGVSLCQTPFQFITTIFKMCFTHCIPGSLCMILGDFSMIFILLLNVFKGLGSFFWESNVRGLLPLSLPMSWGLKNPRSKRGHTLKTRNAKDYHDYTWVNNI